MQEPHLKQTTQQSIRAFSDSKNHNDKIDFIRQNNASIADDYEIASDIIKHFYLKREAEALATLKPANISRRFEAAVGSNLVDGVEEAMIEKMGERKIQPNSLQAAIDALIHPVMAYLRSKGLHPSKDFSYTFHDTHRQAYWFKFNIERQVMNKPDSNPRPMMVQIKPVGINVVGLINPSRVGTLELASDISKMVLFYASKAVIELGKQQGLGRVEASDDELAFHMDAFADDIYEFAKDASSRSLSVNIGIVNSLNTISQVCIDIERTTEWRNAA